MAMNFDQVKSICRACLATNIKMASAKQYEAEFKDLTGITISPSDGLPQWLCYECIALLQKCVRFRKKVINSHQTLTQYVMERRQNAIPSKKSIEVDVDMRLVYSSGGVKHEPVFDSNESNATEEKCREENLLINVRESSICERAEINNKKRCMTTFNCENRTEQRESNLPVVGDIQVDIVKVEIKDETSCGYNDDITIEELSIEKQIELRCKQQTDREKVSFQLVPAGPCASVQAKYLGKHSDVSSTPRQQVDGRNVKSNVYSDKRVNGNLCSSVKLYICDECNKCFSNKRLLIAHISEHTQLKPNEILYRCNVCNTHVRITKEEKQYKCDVCKKSFRHKGDYTKHRLIHTGQKPYKCDVCAKSFNRKGNRNIHMRIHTGERPYKCTVCTKSYKTKFALQKHNLKHTDDKPYKGGV